MSEGGGGIVIPVMLDVAGVLAALDAVEGRAEGGAAVPPPPPLAEGGSEREEAVGVGAPEYTPSEAGRLLAAGQIAQGEAFIASVPEEHQPAARAAVAEQAAEERKQLLNSVGRNVLAAGGTEEEAAKARKSASDAYGSETRSTNKRIADIEGAGLLEGHQGAAVALARYTDVFDRVGSAHGVQGDRLAGALGGLADQVGGVAFVAPDASKSQAELDRHAAAVGKAADEAEKAAPVAAPPTEATLIHTQPALVNTVLEQAQASTNPEIQATLARAQPEIIPDGRKADPLQSILRLTAGSEDEFKNLLTNPDLHAGLDETKISKVLPRINTAIDKGVGEQQAQVAQLEAQAQRAAEAARAAQGIAASAAAPAAALAERAVPSFSSVVPTPEAAFAPPLLGGLGDQYPALAAEASAAQQAFLLQSETVRATKAGSLDPAADAKKALEQYQLAASPVIDEQINDLTGPRRVGEKQEVFDKRKESALLGYDEDLKTARTGVEERVQSIAGSDPGDEARLNALAIILQETMQHLVAATEAGTEGLARFTAEIEATRRTTAGTPTTLAPLSPQAAALVEEARQDPSTPRLPAIGVRSVGEEGSVASFDPRQVDTITARILGSNAGSQAPKGVREEIETAFGGSAQAFAERTQTQIHEPNIPPDKIIAARDQILASLETATGDKRLSVPTDEIGKAYVQTVAPGRVTVTDEGFTLTKGAKPHLIEALHGEVPYVPVLRPPEARPVIESVPVETPEEVGRRKEAEALRERQATENFQLRRREDDETPDHRSQTNDLTDPQFAALRKIAAVNPELPGAPQVLRNDKGAPRLSFNTAEAGELASSLNSAASGAGASANDVYGIIKRVRSAGYVATSPGKGEIPALDQYIAAERAQPGQEEFSSKDLPGSPQKVGPLAGTESIKYNLGDAEALAQHLHSASEHYKKIDTSAAQSVENAAEISRGLEALAITIEKDAGLYKSLPSAIGGAGEVSLTAKHQEILGKIQDTGNELPAGATVEGSKLILPRKQDANEVFKSIESSRLALGLTSGPENASVASLAKRLEAARVRPLELPVPPAPPEEPPTEGRVPLGLDLGRLEQDTARNVIRLAETSGTPLAGNPVVSGKDIHVESGTQEEFTRGFAGIRADLLASPSTTPVTRSTLNTITHGLGLEPSNLTAEPIHLFPEPPKSPLSDAAPFVRKAHEILADQPDRELDPVALGNALKEAGEKIFSSSHVLDTAKNNDQFFSTRKGPNGEDLIGAKPQPGEAPPLPLLKKGTTRDLYDTLSTGGPLSVSDAVASTPFTIKKIAKLPEQHSDYLAITGEGDEQQIHAKNRHGDLIPARPDITEAAEAGPRLAGPPAEPARLSTGAPAAPTPVVPIESEPEVAPLKEDANQRYYRQQAEVLAAHRKAHPEYDTVEDATAPDTVPAGGGKKKEPEKAAGTGGTTPPPPPPGTTTAAPGDDEHREPPTKNVHGEEAAEAAVAEEEDQARRQFFVPSAARPFVDEALRHKDLEDYRAQYDEEGSLTRPSQIKSIGPVYDVPEAAAPALAGSLSEVLGKVPENTPGLGQGVRDKLFGDINEQPLLGPTSPTLGLEEKQAGVGEKLTGTGEGAQLTSLGKLQAEVDQAVAELASTITREIRKSTQFAERSFLDSRAQTQGQLNVGERVLGSPDALAERGALQVQRTVLSTATGQAAREQAGFEEANRGAVVLTAQGRVDEARAKLPTKNKAGVEEGGTVDLAAEAQRLNLGFRTAVDRILITTEEFGESIGAAFRKGTSSVEAGLINVSPEDRVARQTATASEGYENAVASQDEGVQSIRQATAEIVAALKSSADNIRKGTPEYAQQQAEGQITTAQAKSAKVQEILGTEGGVDTLAAAQADEALLRKKTQDALGPALRARGLPVPGKEPSTGAFSNVYNKVLGKDEGTPTPFSSASQFFGRGALGAVQYGLPSIALFSAASKLRESITEAEQLEIAFRKVDDQYDAIFGASGQAKASAFKQQILDLSAASGQSATELAAAGQQITGALQGVTASNTSKIGGPQENVSGAKLTSESLKAVSQLSKITGAPIQDLSDETSAITQAYNKTPAAVGDIAVHLQQETGVPAADTIKGISESALAAKQGGFSLSEYAALFAGVQQKLGATSAAGIATSFNRTFPGLAEDPSKLQALAEGNGADNPLLKNKLFAQGLETGNVKDILTGLGQDYSKLNPHLQTLAATTLDVGSPRNLQAVLGALNSSGTQKLVAGIDAGDATGATAKQYTEIMDTLSGRVSQLKGEFQKLGIELYNAGLGRIFEDAATAAEGLLKVLTGAADIIAALNRDTDGLLSIFLELVLAAKAFSIVTSAAAGSQALGGVVGAVGRGLGGTASTAAAETSDSLVATAAGLGPLAILARKKIIRKGGTPPLLPGQKAPEEVTPEVLPNVTPGSAATDETVVHSDAVLAAGAKDLSAVDEQAVLRSVQTDIDPVVTATVASQLGVLRQAISSRFKTLLPNVGNTEELAPVVGGAEQLAFPLTTAPVQGELFSAADTVVPAATSEAPGILAGLAGVGTAAAASLAGAVSLGGAATALPLAIPAVALGFAHIANSQRQAAQAKDATLSDKQLLASLGTPVNTGHIGKRFETGISNIEQFFPFGGTDYTQDQIAQQQINKNAVARLDRKGSDIFDAVKEGGGEKDFASEALKHLTGQGKSQLKTIRGKGDTDFDVTKHLSDDKLNGGLNAKDIDALIKDYDKGKLGAADALNVLINSAETDKATAKKIGEALQKHNTKSGSASRADEDKQVGNYLQSQGGQALDTEVSRYSAGTASATQVEGAYNAHISNLQRIYDAKKKEGIDDQATAKLLADAETARDQFYTQVAQTAQQVNAALYSVQPGHSDVGAAQQAISVQEGLYAIAKSPQARAAAAAAITQGYQAQEQTALSLAENPIEAAAVGRSAPPLKPKDVQILAGAQAYVPTSDLGKIAAAYSSATGNDEAGYVSDATGALAKGGKAAADEQAAILKRIKSLQEKKIGDFAKYGANSKQVHADQAGIDSLSQLQSAGAAAISQVTQDSANQSKEQQVLLDRQAAVYDLQLQQIQATRTNNQIKLLQQQANPHSAVAADVVAVQQAQNLQAYDQAAVTSDLSRGDLAGAAQAGADLIAQKTAQVQAQQQIPYDQYALAQSAAAAQKAQIGYQASQQIGNPTPSNLGQISSVSQIGFQIQQANIDVQTAQKGIALATSQNDQQLLNQSQQALKSALTQLASLDQQRIQAVIAYQQAQDSLYQAYADATGNVAISSAAQLKTALDNLKSVRANTKDPNYSTDVVAAETAAKSAQNTANQGIYQDATQDVQVGLDLHKITVTQAISRLRGLEVEFQGNKQEFQQLEEQIYSLQQGANLEYNIPTQLLSVPSLYTSRSLDQKGAQTFDQYANTGPGHQIINDNKTVNLTVNVAPGTDQTALINTLQSTLGHNSNSYGLTAQF